MNLNTLMIPDLQRYSFFLHLCPIWWRFGWKRQWTSSSSDLSLQSTLPSQSHNFEMHSDPARIQVNRYIPCKQNKNTVHHIKFMLLLVSSEWESLYVYFFSRILYSLHFELRTIRLLNMTNFQKCSIKNLIL